MRSNDGMTSPRMRRVANRDPVHATEAVVSTIQFVRDPISDIPNSGSSDTTYDTSDGGLGLDSLRVRLLANRGRKDSRFKEWS